MELCAALLPAVVAADGANATALGRALQAQAPSMKDVASAWLRPRDRSREEFDRLRHAQNSVTTITAASASAAPPVTRQQQQQKRLVDLVTAGRVAAVRTAIESHGVDPAALRCGDQEASLLHYAALHSPAHLRGGGVTGGVTGGVSGVSRAEEEVGVDGGAVSVRGTIDLLLNTFGVAVDACTRNGATALHWAAGHGNVRFGDLMSLHCARERGRERKKEIEK
jgi:hypothetical protein